MAETQKTPECKENASEPIITTARKELTDLITDIDKIETTQSSAEKRQELLIQTLLDKKEKIRGKLSPNLIFKLNALKPGLILDLFSNKNGNFYEVTFKSDDGTYNAFAEKKIGLCTLPAEIREVKVLDDKGRERIGIRRGISGSFFDEKGYVEILNNYKFEYKTQDAKLQQSYETAKLEAKKNSDALVADSSKATLISGLTDKFNANQPEEGCKEKLTQQEITKRTFEIAYLNDMDPYLLISILSEDSKPSLFTKIVNKEDVAKLTFEAKLYLLVRAIQIIQDDFEKVEQWDTSLIEHYGIETNGVKNISAFDDENNVSPVFAIYLASFFNDLDEPAGLNSCESLIKKYNSLNQDNNPLNRDTDIKREIKSTFKQIEQYQLSPGHKNEKLGLTRPVDEEYLKETGKSRPSRTEPSTLKIATGSERDQETIKQIGSKKISELNEKESHALARAVFKDGPGAKLLIEMDQKYNANGNIIKTIICIGIHEGYLQFQRMNGDQGGGYSMTTFQLHETPDERGGFRATKDKFKRCLNNGIGIYEKLFPGSEINIDELTPEDKDVISYIGYLDENGKKGLFEKLAKIDKLDEEDLITFIHSRVQVGIRPIGEDVYNMMYHDKGYLNIIAADPQ